MNLSNTNFAFMLALHELFAAITALKGAVQEPELGSTRVEICKMAKRIAMAVDSHDEDALWKIEHEIEAWGRIGSNVTVPVRERGAVVDALISIRCMRTGE